MTFPVRTTPFPVLVNGGRLTNLGPNVVYYNNQEPREQSDYDAQLASGDSVSLEGTQWLFSPGTTGTGNTAVPGATVELAPAPVEEIVSSTILQDPILGWSARPVSSSPLLWVGWDDPTELMEDYDTFIAVPEP